MRERPIIFNSEMVRAVMEGRKVQTRRIIVPSMRTADAQFELHQQPDGSWRPMHTFNEGSFDSKGCERPINCPFGAVGDRLWVRETWQVARETSDAETGSEYDVFPWDSELFGDPREHLNGSARFGIKSGLFYAADGEDSNPSVFYDCIGLNGKVLSKKEISWCPSIHMPRWASRITLEITGVRVERLTALSDDDARNEGCPAQLPHNPEDEHQARTWFRGLWSELYGEESWQANPWVWVIEFKRVEGV